MLLTLEGKVTGILGVACACWNSLPIAATTTAGVNRLSESIHVSCLMAPQNEASSRPRVSMARSLRAVHGWP